MTWLCCAPRCMTFSMHWKGSQLGAKCAVMRIRTSKFEAWQHELCQLKLMIKMPPGRLPLEMFQAHPFGQRPQDMLRTGGMTYPSCKIWRECLEAPQEELEALLVRRRPGTPY